YFKMRNRSNENKRHAKHYNKN
ncbi:unnamed protein product, partial [Brachionus calyciflorus]